MPEAQKYKLDGGRMSPSGHSALLCKCYVKVNVNVKVKVNVDVMLMLMSK